MYPQNRPMLMEYFSPAKINLYLYVTGRRPDGFHELNSLFAKLDIADRLTFIRLPAHEGPLLDMDGGPALPIRLTTSEPNLPTDRRNFIVQAAERLLKVVGERAVSMPVEINLVKNVPLGGGLGGGSSNVAVTLTALNKLWEAGLGSGELSELAAEISSDAPFFFGPAQALITGRGEHVSPLPRVWPFHAVLICPPFGCHTAEVYRAFAAGIRTPLPDRLLTPTDFWRTDGSPCPPTEMAPQLVNMLLPAAMHVQPTLENILAEASDLSHRPIHLSGSGSTLFILADTPEGAGQIVARLSPLSAHGCRLIPTASQDEATHP